MTKFDIFSIIFYPLLAFKDVFSFVTTQNKLYFILAIVWYIVSVWNLQRICDMYPLEKKKPK